MNSLGREKQNTKKEPLFTKETLGVVLLIFTTLSLVCLITKNLVFGKLGIFIYQFIFGIFGYFAYAVQIAFILLSIRLLFGKKINISARYKLLITVAFILVALFSHILSIGSSVNTYRDYIVASYGKDGIFSAGGLFTGLVAYLFVALLSKVGSLVIIGICFLGTTYLIVKDLKFTKINSQKTSSRFKGAFVENKSVVDSAVIESQQTEGQGVDENVSAQAENKKLHLFINDGVGFAFKSKKEIARENSDSALKLEKNGGMTVVCPNGSYSEEYAEELRQKMEYIKTPAKIKIENKTPNFNSPEVSNVINQSVVENSVKDIPSFFHDDTEEISMESDVKKESNDFVKEEDNSFTAPLSEAESHANDFVSKYATNTEDDIETEEVEETNEKQDFKPIETIDTAKKEEENTITTPNNSALDEQIELLRESRARELLRGEMGEKKEEQQEEKQQDIIKDISEQVEKTNDQIKEEKEVNKDFVIPKREIFTPKIEEKQEIVEEKVEEVKKEKVIPPVNRIYYRPPLDLLKEYDKNRGGEEDHDGRMAIIKNTLEDFRINAEPQSYVQGPTVTRYEMMMPAGISVKKVLTLDEDLRMRLASRTGIRIEAPIPGKNLVGIEVANAHPVTVGLKEILEDMATKPSKPGSMVFAIGKDIVGKSITDDISKGPHFLVAGTTGSGKSVCLNVMIVSLIMRYSPEELRLILVDPKGNEFRPYEHIPHLLIDEIITEPKKALAALSWAHVEMEKRYGMLKDMGGLRDIDAYNQAIDSKTPKMPRIVMVVDELSNLMESCKKEMEARILSIAQKARAVGIHLVLATQRPSVDVITGTIKANLPSRIALKVTNFPDSNTILGEGGAEKLLGYGDMLYKNSSMGECERYQGAWICDEEINNIVSYIKEKNISYFDEEMSEFLEKETKPKQEEVAEAEGGEVDGVNDFFLKVLWFAVTSGSASISLFQRRFSIGYARAGALVDRMERMGYVSGNEGSKARRVLLTREEFENRYGPMDEA